MLSKIQSFCCVLVCSIFIWCQLNQVKQFTMAKGRSFEPDEELSEVCTRLWELDENHAEPGLDYEIDLQGYVTDARQVRGDWARYHLFSWVDEDKLFERETYKAFRALLDNYETETGRAEVVTAEEEQENWTFINAIMATPVMQEAHRYLVSQEKAPSDETEFKDLLYDLWFRLYKRLREDNEKDSSGFEHVFVGETRDQSIIGFHNWIQFYLQEKRHNIDYKGYFRRGTAKEEFPRLITLQFTWKKGGTKPIGSSFVGTSPEFEVALYTVVFLTGTRDRIALNIADYQVEVICHGHGRGLGTCFPIAK